MIYFKKLHLQHFSAEAFSYAAQKPDKCTYTVFAQKFQKNMKKKKKKKKKKEERSNFRFRLNLVVILLQVMYLDTCSRHPFLQKKSDFGQIVS